MTNERYNIGLLCDYTLQNFWKKLDKNASVSEAKRMYEEFFNSNLNAINESVDVFMKDKEMIFESAADMRKKRQLETPLTRSEDAIPDDDVEAAEEVATSGNADSDDYKIEVLNVSGDPSKKRGVRDINFYTDTFYQGMVNGDYEGTFKFTDTILPPSLYDTQNVEDFTAVMAFKDFPNIDLSGWDMTSAKILDGLFYKSTFNNNSIKKWIFMKVTSLKNMFVGSDMQDQDTIDAWEKWVMGGGLPYLPKLGKMSAESSEEIMQQMKDNMTGAEGIAARIAKMKSIKKDKMMYDENKKHRVMSSSEFVNENFGDAMRRFGSAIKNAATKFMMKLRDGFTFFLDKAGLFFKANMPSNIVKFIKDGNVAGVYAEQGKAISYAGNGSGYYEEIKKGSLEYNNYIKFMEAVSKFGAKNESIDMEGAILDEARVGLYSKQREANGQVVQIIGAPDVDTEYLISELKRNINEVKTTGKSLAAPMIVWGAPGIGKTSIPKTLIKAANEEVVKGGGSDEEKMAIIVIDCSILQAGDLAMPMPVKSKSFEQIKQQNPAVVNMMKILKMKDDDVETLEISRSDDAPKSWLPVYKVCGDRKQNKLLDAIANGAQTPVYDDEGYIENYEYSGNGGILMFDEFLRADPDTLMGIAQLMMNRELLTGYRLGSKWVIMGCSNRPLDDNQIKEVWDTLSPALKQRYMGVNFVPTYSDWVKWAKEKGGFDDITLDFIGGKDPYGDQSRWHNIDPTASTGSNESRTISPRQWSKLVEELNRKVRLDGVEDYIGLGKKVFLTTVMQFLPDAIAKEYVDMYMASGGASFKYKWNDIVADPEMKVDSKTSAKVIANNLTNYVKANFSSTKPPKPEELSVVVDFLDRNFSTLGNIIGEFVCKVWKYCDLFEAGEEYDPIWDKFDNAHPSLHLGELYDTVGER